MSEEAQDSMSSNTYIIGDIHGEYEKVVHLLRGANLVDDRLCWDASDATLWFMGDYFDRGTDGVAVVDLIMRLQVEADRAGGKVGALLGNHDFVILSALWLGSKPSGGPTGTFYGDWKFNGGLDSDLERLTEEHTVWLTSLPALARLGDWLLMHADSTLYTRYGATIEEVNEAIRTILYGRDVMAWDRLLGDFSTREFGDHMPDGRQKVSLVLRTYGARRLIHGHTPITKMTEEPPEEVTEALVYDGGRCVNVDAGMYRGSPGFVYRLPDREAEVYAASGGS